MSNIFTIIYSLIPAIFFMAGIFIGFYMHKEDEVMTPRKVFKKHKEEKKIEAVKQEMEQEEKDLQDYMKAIDEFGV